MSKQLVETLTDAAVMDASYISDDRYFLDRTMRRIFAFEGYGKIRQHRRIL